MTFLIHIEEQASGNYKSFYSVQRCSNIEEEIGGKVEELWVSSKAHTSIQKSFLQGRGN